ncbi:DUF998 domain-containing protein [Demequina muriae]|uniref:DUF998 domain-containing protein n=1 Tax=Demequina muriae TaxID=3051664 RepID=A0ABT8GFQ5_9MICO|nr:DUF998 domain-containing protein [Demequina sp. EGI L300058]MDN4480189.1 DUF998 domain-containing protein [Demequina sp. EGI L300058]
MIAIVGAVAWIGTVAAFHLIRPDLSPGDAYISNYARGDWAWVMQTAFLVNGAGWAAAGLGLRRALDGAPGATALAALAVLAATGMVMAGVFRADPLGTTSSSLEGLVHSRTAGLAFLCFIALGFVGWWALRRADAWAGWELPSLAFGFVTLTLFVTFNAWPSVAGGGFGWWQRLLAAVVIPGALAAIGWRLTRPAHRTVATGLREE